MSHLQLSTMMQVCRQTLLFDCARTMTPVSLLRQPCREAFLHACVMGMGQVLEICQHHMLMQ